MSHTSERKFRETGDQCVGGGEGLAPPTPLEQNTTRKPRMLLLEKKILSRKKRGVGVGGCSGSRSSGLGQRASAYLEDTSNPFSYKKKKRKKKSI